MLLHHLLHLGLRFIAGGRHWETMRRRNLHINKHLTHGSHLKTT